MNQATINKPKLGNIWWLASYPKSGNTWVRMFLLAYLTGEKIDINAARQFVISDLQPDFHPKAKDIHEYLKNYYESLAKLENVCVKTHNANISVDKKRLIPMDRTNGGVYIVRDPRDVALSMSHHYAVDIDQIIETMADETCVIASRFNHMGHVLSSWSTHVNSWRTTNLMMFRYEDLLEHTEEAFKAITKILYLPEHGEERFKFALHESNFNNLKGLEIEHGFAEGGAASNFFRVGEAGQWKEHLTEKQIKKIEKDHRIMMEGCKYL
jgi:hypothetical protein